MFLPRSFSGDRAAVQRLRDLLAEVRDAPHDARSFALFERRDELDRLGINADDLERGVDVDDTMDRHISNLGAVANISAPSSSDHRSPGPDSDVEVRPDAAEELALAGTLIGSRSDGVATYCTYGTPFGTFTQPFAGRVTCPAVYRASPDHGRS